MTTDVLAAPSPIAAQPHAYPDGWRVMRLGDVCDFVMGQSPSSDTYNADGVGLPFLQGKAEFTDHHPNPVQYTTHPLKVADKGAVLISVRAPVGDVNVADQRYVIGRGLAAIKLRKGDNGFLFYLLQHQKARLASMGTGTTFQSINRATLDGFHIPLPPLPEQRAIARVLRAAQEAIAARRREVGLERERKAALMQRLFMRGTRGEATRQTEIGEAPTSWQLVRLGDVARIERGKFTHRPRNDPDYYGGHIPFIQTGDVTASDGQITSYTQTLNEKGLAVSRVFPKGTIVITIAANIGYTGILELDSAFPDSLIGITPSADVDVRYLHYYLVTQQPEMDRQAPQGTQKNINIEFLSPWLVRLPRFAEQREIADILAACDTQIAALEREIALHDELFRALLEELMSGRLSALGLVEGDEAVEEDAVGVE